ncbi:WD repeat-containing protein [Cladophialophora carrionii]|uniref:WD repeat-containing protein n=1 Tax=Cladophialophora carrionii TaxID=86049 RepID=A0A1C1C7J1_9EURO|nr:WD repeat-containing protein [Cladophialophora carrionii]
MAEGFMTTSQPTCVASSLNPADSPTQAPSSERAFFRNVQWSADGTSLVASLSDNSIQTYIVPPDLLEETPKLRLLSPYCTIQSSESVNAVMGYPLFSLQDTPTALVLSSTRDHPIRLTSALTGHLVASYPLVNPMTDEFISPHSLLFSRSGDRFAAGSESLISVFDLSRPGEGPTSSMPTGPKRKGTNYNDATTMRGIVSALAVDASSGLLAAGTYSRYVALYDALGQGSCIGAFSVKGTSADEQIGGSGVTQVSWSPCGRYLYIAERKSDGVMLYDIRKTGQLLSWLRSRNAQTNQRLGFDAVATDDQGGHEVWAGGLDGLFRIWKDPHQHEGAVAPTLEFKGHDDAISSVVVHPFGGVVATSSGQRHLIAPDDEESFQQLASDYSLKIWTL